jgi:hypothetical protein
MKVEIVSSRSNSPSGIDKCEIGCGTDASKIDAECTKFCNWAEVPVFKLGGAVTTRDVGEIVRRSISEFGKEKMKEELLLVFKELFPEKFLQTFASVVRSGCTISTICNEPSEEHLVRSSEIQTEVLEEHSVCSLETQTETPTETPTKIVSSGSVILSSETRTVPMTLEECFANLVLIAGKFDT